jgi:hypothetical protein
MPPCGIPLKYGIILCLFCDTYILCSLLYAGPIHYILGPKVINLSELSLNFKLLNIIF